MSGVEMELKMAEWRRKTAEGTLELPEMIEAVKYMRNERVSAGKAAATSHAKKKKAFKEIPCADDLLAEMEEL